MTTMNSIVSTDASSLPVSPVAWHPALLAAAERHRQFWDGRRRSLVKIQIHDPTPPAVEPVPFDGMDWAHDFERYVERGVTNGIAAARRRLDAGIPDESIPGYFPYFGISIHASFFGGEVSFGGGTSYMKHPLDRAADWSQLRADFDGNPWPQRLFRGMAWCRDHGEGVLAATYRGANGPLDMANAVIGDVLYTELYDDETNMAHLLDVCTDAALEMLRRQRAVNSEIAGGRICPMGGIWLPGTMSGHVSLDAACLTGPQGYEQFERPWLERMGTETGGLFIHTHMLGLKCLKPICATPGVAAIAPADDPGQPALIDVLDDVLPMLGDVPLMVRIPAERLDELLAKTAGRRMIYTLTAPDPDGARRLLERIDRACGMDR